MKYASAVLRSFVEKGMARGVSAMVVQDGKTLLREAHGWADVESQTPLDCDAIARMFSMSKVVASVAVMKLYERGQIRLTDPIKQYLPAFEDTRVVVEGRGGVPEYRPAQKDITLYDLLTMRVGIPYDWAPLPMDLGKMVAVEHVKSLYKRVHQDEKTNPWTTQQFAQALAQIPMAFEPGDAFLYGMSTEILGAMVEVVTGMQYGAFLEKEIFTPLGMQDTTFRLNAEQRARLMTMYDYNGPEKPYVNDTGMPMLDLQHLEAAGAGLYSTLDDYSCLGQALLSDELLGRKTISFMTTNHLAPHLVKSFSQQWGMREDFGYGMLMQTMIDRTHTELPCSLGTFGWNGMAGTCFRVDPQEKLSLVLIVQRLPVDNQAFLAPFMQAVYGALK